MYRLTRWVASNKALEEAVNKLQNCPYLVLDSEFVRRTTFYPAPGLIQIASDECIYLIDPLEIDQWQPLKSILENENQIKVLHSATEDLELLELVFNIQLKPFFDTQIAHAFISDTYQISYQQLVHQCLGVSISKSETCSDWTRRPLTDTQKKYAVEDVDYLYQIYPKLRSQLVEKKRLAWAEEEFEMIVISRKTAANWDKLWEKVHLAWRLPPEKQSVLQQLCIFRERQARLDNVPRKRVIPSACLFDLANQCPQTVNKLASIKKISPRHLKSYGEKMIEVIQKAPKAAVVGNHCKPPFVIPDELKIYARAIKTHCKDIAKQQGFAPALLSGNAFVRSMVQHYARTGAFKIPNKVKGWRRALLEPGLITMLNNIKI